MREMASIEISRAVRELHTKVEGSRLRKFYDFGNGSFRIFFYNKAGNLHIYCSLLSTFNETSLVEEADEATTFAMSIRKRLENSLLTSLGQYGSDRIIVLEFGNDGFRLLIEMYGKGNVILINSDGVIEACYKRIRYKGRSIAIGNHYSLPEGSPFRFENPTEEAALKAMENVPSGKKLIRFLGDRINIGPLYLEDIILRAGMDPAKTMAEEADLKAIAREIVAFFMRIEEEKPRVYKENSEIKDYAIAGVRRYDGLEIEKYESLNLLLDSIYAEGRVIRADTGKIELVEKTRANIEEQKRLLVIANTEAEYYSNSGRTVFAHMHEINTVIDYLKRHRNATLDEVRGIFPGIVIKELDLKNKVVRIEVE